MDIFHSNLRVKPSNHWNASGKRGIERELERKRQTDWPSVEQIITGDIYKDPHIFALAYMLLKETLWINENITIQANVLK